MISDLQLYVLHCISNKQYKCFVNFYTALNLSISRTVLAKITTIFGIVVKFDKQGIKIAAPAPTSFNGAGSRSGCRSGSPRSIVAPAPGLDPLGQCWLRLQVWIHSVNSGAG